MMFALLKVDARIRARNLEAGGKGFGVVWFSLVWMEVGRWSVFFFFLGRKQ